MKWVKKSFAETIEEVIAENFNKPIEDIDKFPTNTHKYSVEVAKRLEEIAKEGKSVFIVGDYDADGVTSCVELSLILDELGIDYKVYIPKRFTDGYGINQNILSKIDGDVLITVDNGTACGLDFGMETIIIDHHLPSDKLPEGLIYNPHVNNEDFKDFCAAGLVYKISKNLPISKKTKDFIEILACIGTIADVMPLVNENRAIVKKGIKLIKTYYEEMSEILMCLPESFNAQDIAFKVAPLINASGRMNDDGGQIAYETLYKLFKGNDTTLKELAKVNKERKELQEKFFKIADDSYNGMCPIIVKLDDCPEGIVGIIAGKLTEKYGYPSFVFTDNKDKTFLKGSARGVADFNVKEFLDGYKDLFIKYGGHVGAAGFSMDYENYEKFKECERRGEEPVLYYDIDLGNINEIIIKNLVRALNHYEPFGEGNPRPKFKITADVDSTKYIGTNGIKLYCDGNFTAISFTERDNLEHATKVDIIGELSLNNFNNIITPQVDIIDYKVIEETKEFIPEFMR